MRKAILEVGGQLLVTADHGNAEQMVNHETGKPPYSPYNECCAIDFSGSSGYTPNNLNQVKLCDIAPTMLALAHIDKPSNMTGESLLLD